MAKHSIALIGFMGTGKTVIGKELARHLGSDYKFIETDQIIIEMTGKSIAKIFKEEGEHRFRQYEVKACKEVSKLKKVIISCGGGIVLNKVNIRNLKKNCYIILLTATIDEIYNRVINNGKEKRPLLDKDSPKKEIEKILEFRDPYYKSAAEITIDTTNKEINEIVYEIITKTKMND